MPNEIQIKILADKLPGIGNVDVEVIETDGKRWSATFFSLDGVEALFEKNAVTGECAGGTYLWASDMILVRELSEATISRTISNLRTAGEFDRAFQLLGDD